MGKGRKICNYLSAACHIVSIEHSHCWLQPHASTSAWWFHGHLWHGACSSSCTVPWHFLQPADEPHLAVGADPCQGVGCGTPQIPPCFCRLVTGHPPQEVFPVTGGHRSAWGSVRQGWVFSWISSQHLEICTQIFHIHLFASNHFPPPLFFNAGEGRRGGQQYCFQSQERAFAAFSWPVKQATRTWVC